MSARALALACALLGLSACGTATDPRPALIASQSLQPAPALSRDDLQDLANDAPMPGSDTNFLWFWWDGDLPEVQADETVSLEEFRARHQLDTGEWDTFAAALRSAFPDSLRVYESGRECENCTETVYIVEGHGPNGVGGFLGSVFWDH